MGQDSQFCEYPEEEGEESLEGLFLRTFQAFFFCFSFVFLLFSFVFPLFSHPIGNPGLLASLGTQLESRGDILKHFEGLFKYLGGP